MPTILKKITVFTLVFLAVFISTGMTHIFATGDSAASNSASLNCDANTNLIIDGGFETPIITNPKLWDIVSIPTVESPWTSTYSNYGLEIQAGVGGWLPASGAQYAEIDGGIGHEISQVIPTTLGNTYTLSFVTSPRPDVSVATSSMNVLVNNTLLETVNSPATTTSQTEWHPHSYTFTATGTSTKITFVDSKPISTGTGIFLDNVKVICSGQPVVTNPPVNTCDANTNLILDGGFEKPIITNPKLWDIVAIPTQDAPWMSTYSNYGLEIQAGVRGWLPAEGTQYAEIDGGSGHQVFQTISTVPGNTYSLSFVTSPRPDISTATSSMNVLINDVLKDTINSSGPIVSQTTWLPHTYTFVATGTSTKITFVDSKPISTGTGIFLDKVNVTCAGSGQPAANTSPVVTLVGANPVTITVGQTYTDSGATATDQEDGNITSKIIATSTVNTNVVGTYTVTYSVTDSSGLSATPVIRTVNVIAAPTLSCAITSQTQTGWYGTYFNYSSTTLGMELPTSQWGTSYGDPLGSVKPWTANWYGSQFTRFNRVDSALTFGDNFFPFDSAPEEIINGHEYYFGVHEAATVTATTTGSYKYTLTSDDDAWVYVDGHLVGDNSGVHMSTTLIGTTTLTSGSHVVDIFFAERHMIQSSFAFAFEDASLSIKPYSSLCTMNHPPVITLIGANPATVNVGDTFVDPGATATDQEDGNITSKIIATSTVNTSAAGTYAISYSVTDLGGLSASTTRSVIVQNPNNGGGPTTGKITFCLVLADNNNQIATSSANLPSGIFSLNFASTTSISSSTISSRTWNAMSFTPNTKIILSTGQDALCQTIDNLSFGSYYYSPLSVSGSQWNTPKYNDQNNQQVNNVFDFFPYSGELFTATTTDDAARNLNSDGNIVLNASNRERTLVMYDTYNPAPQCSLPTVSSSLTASATVNNSFTYTLTGSTTSATTTPLTFSVATSTLPTGLSFATSTNTISGTPTQTGTYNIALKAENTCGFNIQTLILTVLAGGTGGGGGIPGADIVVTKTADKATANVGENITYTITVKNNGSLDATNVAVTDILPSTLTFVSSTSPIGNYATSTGIWTIGNLLNGSSTALTLVAKINAGTEGRKITNTAVVSSTQSDPNTANNTTSADITVNTPATTPACSANCGGGGGGGGNGPIVPNTLTIFNEQVVETVPGVAFVTWNTTLPATRRVVYGNGSNASLGLAPNYGYTNSTDFVGTPVLTQHSMVVSVVPGQTYYFRPVSTNGTNTAIGKELTLNPATTTGGTTGGTASNSCYYLYDFLRKDFNNNPVEVKKLQFFLKTLEGFSNLEVTGVYDDATIAAVDAFQIRYKDEILTPWGYDGTQGTDYTYILTKKKVNEIYCQHAFPVTPLEQAEIDATRALLESLRNAGIEVGNPPPATTTPTPLENNVVGMGTTSGSSFGLNSTTLGGISSTTRDIASRMTANVLSAGRTLGSLALAFFAWPFGSSTWDSLLNGIKTLGNNFLSWLIFSLILALIAISYLWYREYKNNKKIEEIKQIEEINKEIDLK